MTKPELEQLFDNNFDCYADVEPTGGIPAMTKEKFVEIASSQLKPPVMQKIYGVVEWVNNHPILNGMQAFKDKESALKYCGTRLNGQINKEIYAEQTIIEINFSA